ncbi:MAG: acyloxyacyl hydrolase [Gammaproteobacteria bacterium]|nr:acyloxyacyl hydrolase [Gammaproteobacteria bacterium]
MRKALLIFVFCLCSKAALAFPCSWQGATISYGVGLPDSLHGTHISYRFLPQVFDWKNVQIYIDTSAGFWRVNYHKDSSITIAAIAPVLRLNFPTIKNAATPYLELSTGAAVMSQDTLGPRDLGSNFAFQDMIGLGVTFGSNRQFDLSWHLLHYSNAGLAKRNAGIDVDTLFSFGYYF